MFFTDLFHSFAAGIYYVKNETLLAMKKVLALLAVFAAYSVVLFSEEVKKTYTKIRSAEELVEGNYLIVAQTGGTWYALGYQASSNRPAVVVEVVDDKITTEVATSSSDRGIPYEIAFEYSSKEWYLKDIVGEKYLASNTGENLKLQSGKETDYRWSVESWEADGEVAFVNDRAYMGVTSTGSYFRCYNSSSGHQIYLFKETDSSSEEPEDPEDPEDPDPGADEPAPTPEPDDGGGSGCNAGLGGLALLAGIPLIARKKK